MSLGLVHLLFQGLIDMSTALGQDSGTRTTWQNINTHLAPLPTMTRNGQTVFRETSVGADFVNDGNDIDIQAVYPGSQVGLDSSADAAADRPQHDRPADPPGTAATHRPRSTPAAAWSATTRARS